MSNKKQSLFVRPMPPGCQRQHLQIHQLVVDIFKQIGLFYFHSILGGGGKSPGSPSRGTSGGQKFLIMLSGRVKIFQNIFQGKCTFTKMSREVIETIPFLHT